MSTIYQIPATTSSSPGGGSVGGASSLTTSGAVPYVVSSGVLAQDQTSGGQFFWDATNHRLGLGTVSPDSIIKIGTQSTASVDPAVTVGRIISTGSGNAHAFSDSSNVSRSGVIGYNSYDARITMSGTNAFDHYAGFQHAPTFTASNTTANVYGIYTLTSMSAGIITNNYGIFAENPAITGTGAITNNFGVYAASMTSGTNKWGFYSVGSSNYMAGLILGTQNTYYNADVVQLQLATNAGDARMRLLQIGNNFWDVAAVSGTTRFAIKDINATEYLTILTGGNTGILQNNPSQKLDVTGNMRATGGIISAAVTVANLPPVPVDGMRASVTDSNAGSFTLGLGLVVTGGGTTHVPVYYDGTNWRIG